MSVKTAKNVNVKEWIYIAIMFILFFGTQFLPPFGLITELGMKVLGVFFGLLWGWVFVDIVWSSLLGFFILALTGWQLPLVSMMTGFGNATTVMILMSYCFAYCLSKVGVSEAIAYWVLSKKVFINRPWALCIAITLTTQFISMTGGAFAGIFLVWGVVKSIADLNGIEKGHAITNLLYALVLYAGMLGGLMVPFMGGVLMYGGFLTKATGVVIAGLPFLFAGELYGIISEIALVFVAKVVLRIDASKFNINEALCMEYKAYKTSKTQKIGLVATLVFFLALMLPSVFKGAFWATIGSWGIVGWSIIYMVFFNIMKDEDGKLICTVADCFTHGIAWGPVLLFMVTIPLATAMESEEVGILATAMSACNKIFGGLSLTVLYIAIVVVMGFLTQFLHNLVMAAIFIPIFAPIVMGMGGNPYTFFILIFATLSCSYATPAASMQAALIFAHDDVPPKYAYILGWMYYIVSCIVLIIMIPLFNIIFAGMTW